jgi:hypothetical protein
MVIAMTTSTHVYLGLGLLFAGLFIAYIGSSWGPEDRAAGPVAAIGLLILIAGVISLMTS